ncbi:MAG: UDP-N-acetylmuramate--L-alanine ligase [Candidatus Shapirobacteria bacterium]|nr:UDP-N-acetylmuramate--L-alanine ligase [Candidatus Shapirobacteria bacterium]MDD5073969.1 UDP-N-acetylmuramate--L-alanine ligase [Candidatus Shapirobacteria bacterium]MDD5481677.1 UDP-N-acetylmuramate--L-alanine ligase [Candidatus Shapirobacteria bacterium]
MTKINFNKVRFVHMIGIKGVGMTALAACLKDKNINISGSDIPEIFITDQTLKKMGLSWWENFSTDHISHQNLVIATGSAHQGPDNPEAKAAIRKGIPYLTHGEALGLLMAKKSGISVCGVGGKTTTSAILATVMALAGEKPSFAIGAGEIFPLIWPGHYDKKGQYFIAEADEYATAKGFDHRPRFYWQNPKIVICTNIEHDHPDIYPNQEAVKTVFYQFFDKIPNDGFLVINGDNKNNRAVIAKLNKKIITYGQGDNNNCQIKNISLLPGKTTFSLQYNKQDWGSFIINVPGSHNAFNATAAIITLKNLGISLAKIKQFLPKFIGTKRRFEFLGKTDRLEVWDDYAHHPKQIEATLSAAVYWFNKKPLTVIFQPHTFSRTEKLLNGFAKSLSLANQVFILPVYSAGRETGNSQKLAQKLVKETQKYLPEKTFFYQPTKDKSHLKGIVLTMGAGDVWKIGHNLLK